MASVADDLNSSSSDTDEVPFNNKVESGSITFDLDSSTLAISSREKSPQKVDFKPPPETLNMSRLEDGTSDNLTALSRSFSIKHGHGESSFFVVGPLSGTIPYSGSISLRSDSSTTSTRSFAFPCFLLISHEIVLLCEIVVEYDAFWLIFLGKEKMRAAQSKFMASLNSTEKNEFDGSKSEKEVCLSDVGRVSEESAQVVCSFCRDPDFRSPLSFWIFIQKSRLVSLSDRGTPSWEEIHQSDEECFSIATNKVPDSFARDIVSCSLKMTSSSHLAQFVQSAVNEFAYDGQPGEVDAFLDFIKARLPAVRNTQLPNTSHDTSVNVEYSLEMIEEYMYQSIQRDLHGILLHSNVTKDDEKFSKVEEGLTRSSDSKSALFRKYIASLSRETSENPSASKNVLSCSEDALSKSNIQFTTYDGLVLLIVMVFVFLLVGILCMGSIRKQGIVTFAVNYKGIIWGDKMLITEMVPFIISMAVCGSPQGNMSSILDHVDKGLLYPDIQFWKRASDPILAWDPFSSLMWILFCLPCPFLSSMDSFLSLCASVLCCLCNSDLIRRLSSPYSRRCALLWKILNSSTSAAFYDRSRYANNDMLYGTGTCGLLRELKEVEELGNMFKIPPLDVVLKDVVMRALVIKWSHHFRKEFKVHSFGCALHSTPALPFKLMCLPHIYEDLLQRYIKQHCTDCKSVQDEPALCLLCGRLYSPSWKACCRESGCQALAMACGAGTGLFLLIRRTTILLQRAARQAPWPSPYLDAFGEEVN
ncbi:hypothetical protein HHK36_022198 [Tetracentron sinense]|uniref:E3 ubiquitin-protein ligase n=1 Tax=Tetracentron sinense TaxID=13715 RepID=A0A834YRI2_TETSI|nr:hypothetical protein HHK36_022198 [Tetracentron sinense]